MPNFNSKNKRPIKNFLYLLGLVFLVEMRDSSALSVTSASNSGNLTFSKIYLPSSTTNARFFNNQDGYVTVGGVMEKAGYFIEVFFVSSSFNEINFYIKPPTSLPSGVTCASSKENDTNGFDIKYKCTTSVVSGIPYSITFPISGYVDMNSGSAPISNNTYRVRADNFSSAPSSKRTQAASVSNGVSITTVKPLSISKTSDLSFGKILPSTTLDGTVTSAGVKTGGVQILSAGTSATFSVTGEPNEPIPNITVPSSITLNGSGANTMKAKLQPILPSALDSSGNAAIIINGTLTVDANQAAGSYTGTYTVSVAY
jgi:hypothetical protein